MKNPHTFSGWPSGDCKPVIEISYSPSEIESKWGLIFEKDKDDLDWHLATHVYDSVIGFLVFMKHENSPSSGTVLYVDRDVSTKLAIRQICEKFEISAQNVNWSATTSGGEIKE